MFGEDFDKYKVLRACEGSLLLVSAKGETFPGDIPSLWPRRGVPGHAGKGGEVDNPATARSSPCLSQVVTQPLML